MSAKSVVSAVVGFLTHHVNDLNSVADALSSIVGAVPIDPQDKSNIANVIAELKTSVDNINNFLSNNEVTGGDVTVKESDLVDAVANYLASDAGKAALAAAANPPSNANA